MESGVYRSVHISSYPVTFCVEKRLVRRKHLAEKNFLGVGQLRRRRIPVRGDLGVGMVSESMVNGPFKFGEARGRIYHIFLSGYVVLGSARKKA